MLFETSFYVLSSKGSNGLEFLEDRDDGEWWTTNINKGFKYPKKTDAISKSKTLEFPGHVMKITLLVEA